MIEMAVARLARTADRIDRRVPRAPGAVARIWAASKFLVACLLTPFAIGLVAWRAMANHARAKREMRRLRDFINGIDRAEASDGAHPAHILHLDASKPLVVTSDLHRCISGRLDLVGAQDNRNLYVAMLEWYGDLGFGLIENGDVEDFWMVGGSAWGSMYDALRLTGAALTGCAGDRLRAATYLTHFARIVENNADVYITIRDRFAANGRYARTIGNHDDVFADDRLVAALRGVVGDAPVTRWVTLGTDAGVEAVITHGHETDGWNAPGRDALGKLSSWVADTVRDAPGPATPDDVPPPSTTRALLSGQTHNRLLWVDPRFGASSSYDSLDEELLFDALGGASTDGPWLLMGHTHYPVMEPLSSTGARWWHYANSGHGLGAGMLTALEWPGGAGPYRPRLVAWCWGDHPAWSDLVMDTTPTAIAQGRPVVRVELTASPDGSKLEPIVD